MLRNPGLLPGPGRKYNFGDYRYGFSIPVWGEGALNWNQENDSDGEFSSLTHYDYGFRIYNPAIGRFLSVDPLTRSYPWYTPYQFAGNKPIWAVDLDGLEEYPYQWGNENEVNGETQLVVPNAHVSRYIVPKRGPNPNSSYKYLVYPLRQHGTTPEEAKLGGIGKWAARKANARNQNYVADRLFKHWLLGGGRDYVLNDAEMQSVKVEPFDLTGTHIHHSKTRGGKLGVSWRERIANANRGPTTKLKETLSGLDVGESTSYSVNISGAVGTAGTLGQFTIEISGMLTKTSEGGYSFEGGYVFRDTYDFDVRLFDTKGLRSSQGEDAVRKARFFQLVTGEGDDFDVRSVRIPYRDSGVIPTDENKRP